MCLGSVGEGRRGIEPRGRAGGGGSEARLSPRWASVRAAWFGPCPREDSAAALCVPPRPRPRPGPLRTMGSILSRRIAGVEDIDIQANSAYRYPPKSGERPSPAPGALCETRTWRRAGRAGRSSSAPSAQESGWGTLLGARPSLRPPCPEILAPSIRTPGPAWGRGLTASSRLGDLESTTSPLSSSAPSSAHWGDSRETPRPGVRFWARCWRGVSMVLGASFVLTEWSLS